MKDHDRAFFDQFMIVLGLLVLFAICMYVLAQYISGKTQKQWLKELPEAQNSLQERIEPVGTVAVAGQAGEEDISQEEQLLAAAVPVEEVLSGAQVYNAACFACHAAAVAGAPKLGDAADWGPRIAQGQDLLREHAINGYQGSKGYMPPKGGRADLSDEEIIAAIDYMVEQAQ